MESVYDLDNIKLSSIKSVELQRRGVVAVFQLRNILVVGHARELRAQGAPRGTQFILGTSNSPHMVDTSNDFIFQFRLFVLCLL